MDISGQFWTVLNKILCYNGKIKDNGPGLSFDYELLPTQWFSPDTKQFVLYGMFITPGRKSMLPNPSESNPKVVAQCRTMSHDAQVNTCYHINCQRRTRAHTLPGANRTPKVVTECHPKSRDKRVNTCYTVNR